MEQDVYGGCLLCPLYPLLSIRDVIFQEEQICIHCLKYRFRFLCYWRLDQLSNIETVLEFWYI